jgi:hypothetical protein
MNKATFSYVGLGGDWQGRCGLEETVLVTDLQPEEQLY